MIFAPWSLSTVFTLVWLHALASLLAIWAGMSRIDWFWRAMVVMVVAAMLIPPIAYEPMIYLLVQTAVCAALLGWLRWSIANKDSKKEKRLLRFSFTLADLLKAITVFAVTTVMLTFVVRHGSRFEFGLVVLLGATDGVVSFLQTRLFIKRAIWIWEILGCIGAMLLITLTALLYAELGAAWVGSIYAVREIVSAMIGSAVTIVMIARWLSFTLVAIVQITVVHHSWIATKPTLRLLPLALLFGFALISCVVVVPLWWSMTVLPERPVAILNDPIGRENFEAAASRITVPLPDPDTVSIDELRATARKHEEIIDQTKQSLEQRWERKLDYYPGAALQIAEIGGAREALRLIDIAAIVCVSDQQSGIAAEYALDSIQIGSLWRRGGLIGDGYVGVAMSGFGRNRLRLVRGKLDATQCQRSVERLEAILANQEPAEQIFRRDKLWEVHTGDWLNRLQYALNPRDSVLSIIARSQPFELEESQLSLLLLELSLRRFQLERGNVPERLTELSPQFIERLPMDPFSGKDFVYRRISSEEFLLYSVGTNGVDDGGQRVAWSDLTIKKQGDMFLDLVREAWESTPK